MSLNTEIWTPLEVAEWMSGLEPDTDRKSENSNSSNSNYPDKEKPWVKYSNNLLDVNVNGRLLHNLMAGDLERYGITKVGDQLLLDEAIQTLRSEMDSERITLQSLASTLAVRCRNYRSELSVLCSNKSNNSTSSAPSSSSSSSTSIIYIPTESMASANYLLDSSKTFLRWLTRFPFLGNSEYSEVAKVLAKHCFELAVQSQRDSFADNAIEEVQYLCTKIIEICEKLIHSKDSLVIQPAALDVITLRKRTEQELGLQIESSYFGLHQVSGVRHGSPAQQSGHLEKGDEILQINYQTVLGWPQQNVVNLLNENANEVILTIKRRPRHASANILAHMYLRPSTRLMSNSYRHSKKHNKYSANTLSTINSLPKSHQQSMPISPVPEDDRSCSDSTNSSSGSSPVVLVNVNTSLSIPNNIIDDFNNKPELVTETEGDTEDDSDKRSDNDNSSTMNMRSPSCIDNNKSPATRSPNSRFWKLYPRPRNLIKRRATVTGASPTSTRPPVTFFDDDGNSGGIKGHYRPPLVNSKSAPEKAGITKQDHVINIEAHRITMPSLDDFVLFFVDNNGDKENKDNAKIKPTPPEEPKKSAESNRNKKDGSTSPKDKTGNYGALEPLINEIAEQNDDKKPVLTDTAKPNNSDNREISEKKSAISNTKTILASVKKHNDSQVNTNASEKSKSFTATVSDSLPTKSEISSSIIDKPESSVKKLEKSAAVNLEKSPEIIPLKSKATEKLKEEESKPAEVIKKPDSPPRTIYKGVLHLRQSPSNLLVKSNSLSSTSSTTGYSQNPHHPRWTRHPATLNSHKILQIGSDPAASLKIDLADESQSEVSLASEVHSRPFAFKIDRKLRTSFSGEEKPVGPTGSIVYLAAESQQEFEMWVKLLMKGDASDLNSKPGGAGTKDLMQYRMRNPPLYKRSISLGNSPAYSRRTSPFTHHSSPPQSNLAQSHSGTPPTGRMTTPQHSQSNSQESINQRSSYSSSSLVRKHSLVRSSKLIGASTPSVIGASSSTPSSYSTNSLSRSFVGSYRTNNSTYASPPAAKNNISDSNYNNNNQTPPSRDRKISNSEQVKSEWFNASPSPAASTSPMPRRYFNTSGSTYQSPGTISKAVYSKQDGNFARDNKPSASLTSLDQHHSSRSSTSGSNISSITITSVARRSESDSNAKSPMSPGKPKLPSMGVNMVLARHNVVGQVHNLGSLESKNKEQVVSPVETKSKTTSPKKSSSSSTSSSSDVFLKTDEGISSTENTMRTRDKRSDGGRGGGGGNSRNCPSCGGSTSSSGGGRGDRKVKDCSTQTDNEIVATDLEQLRHFIYEQEGSRV